MPEKLQSLSEKVLQIMSGNNEPSKQITVKYLSEIITARIEEIILAILYEIEESGFGDMLKSGLVITGGVAETANLGNFIYELSGYRVRTGYPKGQLSTAGCGGIKDTSAATSVGLILAAKDELGINCAQICKDPNSAVIIETDEEPEAVPAEDLVQETVEETAEETVQNEEEKIEDPQKLVKKPQKKVKEEKKSIWEGINIFWSRTKKKAEEAAAKTGEIIDGLRNEEV